MEEVWIGLMKKLLFLVNHYLVIYNFRKELITELLHNGYDVTVVSPPGKIDNELLELGCHFVECQIDRRGMNPITDLCLLKFYLKLIKARKPDVVLTYTIKPNVYGGMACQILAVKYITTITGLGTSIENGGLIASFILKLYKFSLKKSSCIFFQNRMDKKKMEDAGIKGDKALLVAGSGVNLEIHSYEDYPDRREGLSFLYLGRIMKNKGVEELLEAAKEVKRIYPKVSFIMAGECEENYSERLLVLTKRGIIHYLGFKENVHELIKKCSAVVLPSYHEGLANVLLEASACGRPVLASNISGCRETFEDEKTGIAFCPRDAESLKAALIRFIILPYEQKREMGILARKKMEREFDRKRVVQSYLEEIEYVIYRTGSETV